MVMGAGLRPPGWAGSYRPAVVLTLAAAPGGSLPGEVFGQRTGAGDHPAAPTPRAPRTGPHGRAQRAADQDVERASAPAMIRKLIPGRLDTPAWAAVAAGLSGRSTANLRLRFAGGVAVPFLRCRCSHVGAKRRIGMHE